MEDIMRKLIIACLYHLISILVLCNILSAGSSHAQSFPDGLVGLSSSEPAVLYSIDASTGLATPIVVLNGNASITGLAFLNRALYGTDLYDFPGDIVSQNAIGSISTSGIISLLSDQNGSANWHGLAADETNNILYIIDHDNSNILTAQFPDGSLTTIGSGAGINGSGMEYDDTHGILYAISIDSTLYTVSTETGTASLIGPTGLPSNNNDIGLAYDECNEILYANHGPLRQLFILDVTTGAATLVGSNVVDAVIDGLAWKGPCGPGSGPNPIPTLSEWGMILSAAGLGLVGLYFAVKRRRIAANF
jgi:hypothetical protein